MLGSALVLLTLALVPATNCAAQVSTADDPLVKACEQAVDEVRVARVELAGLREQIRLRDELDKLKDQFIANLEQQAAFWKLAATERKDALVIDNRIDGIRLEQLAEFRSEVDRLRAENTSLRKSRTRWFAAGVIGGILIPKLP